MQSSSSPAHGHRRPPHGDCDALVHAAPPLEEPPPSYDDATRSSTSPLLVGPPPDYGAFRAYADADESSDASSERDDAEQFLPERIGQVFAVCLVVAILYLFWSTISQPDPDGFQHDHA